MIQKKPCKIYNNGFRNGNNNINITTFFLNWIITLLNFVKMSVIYFDNCQMISSGRFLIIDKWSNQVKDKRELVLNSY